jgi:hypothetical protein
MSSPPPRFHTISFLQLRVRELRQIAEREPPSVAAELRRIADLWSVSAVELEDGAIARRSSASTQPSKSPEASATASNLSDGHAPSFPLPIE